MVIGRKKGQSQKPMQKKKIYPPSHVREEG